MRKLGRKKNILISWLFTYFIVVLVTFISVFLTYHLTKNTITRENLRNNRLVLDTVRTECDRMIDSMEKVALSISQDEHIKATARNATYLDENVRYDVLRVEQRINNYNNVFSGENTVYLYFNVLDIACGAGMLDGISLYNAINLDMNYDDWKNLISADTGNRLVRVVDRDGVPKFVYVIKNYFTRAFNNSNVSLIYILDEEDFGFFDDGTLDGMNLYIKKSENENILINNEFEADAELLNRKIENSTFKEIGGKYLYSACDSKVWNVQYVLLSDADVVYAELSSLQAIYVIMSIIAFGVALLLAYIFARSNYKSIQKISDSVSLYVSEGDDITTLKGLSEVTEKMAKNYVKVVDDNAQKQKKIKKELVRSLLRSDYTQESIEQKIKESKIEFCSDKFAVFVVQLDADMGILANYNMFVNLIVSAVSLKHDATVVDENGFLVCLINFNDGIDTETMKNDIVEMKNQICNMTKNGNVVDMKFASSDIVSGTSNISLAFVEAMSVMDYKMLSKNNDILFMEDIEQSPESSKTFYSFEQEKNFIRAIAAGRCEIAQSLAESIIRSVSTEHSIMRMGSKYLVYDIISSMLKAALQISPSAVQYMHDNNVKLEAEFKNPHTSDEYIAILNPVIEGLCMYVNEGNYRFKTLEETVMKKIYENYSDFNFCLNSLAHELNFHPVYLTSSFKSQCGEGVSARIEKVRLEKAYELLENGENVGSTAAKVGYENAKTFSRAFKRKYGVVPSMVTRIN